MKKHLDEIIHDIKVEALYMEDKVDIDEIIDEAALLKHIDVIETSIAMLTAAVLQQRNRKAKG